MDAPPIAYAELIPPGPGHRTHYLWVLLDCPHCHQRHTHGAGRDGTVDGHRVAHCLDRQDNPGYVIVKATPSDVQALAEEISRRIEERKAEAIERQQARRTQRVQMAARRNVGLAARHAAKLARTTQEEA